MALDLLVYGNPTIDEIVRKDRVHILPGGGVFFSSMAAASLGCRVRLIGNVGHDYPSKYLSWLKQHSVDVALLQRVQGSTTRFRIRYENDKRKLWLLASGAEINSSGILPYGAVHLAPVFNEIAIPDIFRVRSKCEFLSIDYQGMIRTADTTRLVKTVRRRLGNVLRICNIAKGSVEEFNRMGLWEKQNRRLRRLLLHGPEFALITLGKHGSILAIRNGSQFSIPAFPDPDAFDPTGAGDVLIGSWLSVYLRTHDPVWSAAVGSAFASLTSRKMGLSKFVFSRNELLRRSAWVYTRVKRFRRP
ncbi:MAG TPA: PfkB family carbohydrate kinase [Candidatus Bathyarchaeia archaeon]|nr:PfkB family carbohydrate kinase [Candidatus Bathyarchaeia archaeon]